MRFSLLLGFIKPSEVGGFPAIVKVAWFLVFRLTNEPNEMDK